HTEFDLKEMLAKVNNIISFQVEEKKQQFLLSADQNVPDAIYSDEQRLSQVVTNLLSNAIKFTPENGTISLFVRMLGEENGICTLQFEVKDTGIGVSEEQQARLFAQFEQADGSISRKYGGTGLGLTISKQIVEMMDGEIWVESAIGRGASFIFNIKAGIVQQRPSLTAEAGDAAPRQYDEKRFSGKRILIAEDIAINREIILALLEPTGMVIDFAENGQMAYELFCEKASAYSMIFMDIHMPEVDGYEATRMIRMLDNPHAKTVPIIAMTADVFREDIDKCLVAGMNDHVGKPLNPDDILAKLERYMPG
ncbi:response regulator, partial [Ruminococcaceae bacterium OttesenSCG-928-L11]|nr:response regulator [Ruminococcaceae bacterium OttesenSCG-928-L11]